MNKTDAPTAIGPKAYASWRRTPLGVITEEIEQRLILDLMGDLAGHRVLDVWCAGGALPNRGRDGDPGTQAGLSITAVPAACTTPVGVAARALLPLEAGLGRLTTFGAAFVAVCAQRIDGHSNRGGSQQQH